MCLKTKTEKSTKDSYRELPNGYLETIQNENAVYACINYGEAFCPGEIEDGSICIDGNIGTLLAKIKKDE